jgi:hypothetical protein
MRSRHEQESDPREGHRPTRIRPPRKPDAGAVSRPALSAHGVLALQRSAGNAAVARELGRIPAGLPLQRALSYSAAALPANTGNVIPASRRIWLKRLLDNELKTMFGIHPDDRFNNANLGSWKLAHQDDAREIDRLLQLLMAGFNDIDFGVPVTKADITEVNRLLHDVEVTADKGKAAPEAIRRVFIGNEFTFVNESLRTALRKTDPKVKGDVYQKMRAPYEDIVQRWKSAMAGLGGPAPAEEFGTDRMPILVYRFTQAAHGVDWWYKVTPDQACVEVITEKATASDIYAGPIGDIMDQYVFGVAGAVGVEADRLIGGGHINIDERTAFGASDDPAAARVLGAFIEEVNKKRKYWRDRDPDAGNAPFVSELKDKTKKDELTKVISEMDDQKWTIPELVDHLAKRVFDVNNVNNSKDPKYHALNVKAMQNGTPEEERRLEFRRVPAQPDRQALLTQLTEMATMLNDARKRF